MIHLSGVIELRRNIAAARKADRSIALVPTMGCLHEGHRALIATARRESDVVIVSIFVNPLQFGPAEDFDRYPRTIQADAAVCRNDGVDLLFAPEPETIHAPDHSVVVEETSLSRNLCGAHRPGHFRGVTTVVAKLFNLVQPDIAVFGQKDAQQTAVIRRMVRDLHFPVRILSVATVREPDGLALSSRNRYLDRDTRRHAAIIHQSLQTALTSYQQGARDAARIRRKIVAMIESQPAFRVEYAAAVDADTLEPATHLRRNVLLAVAVHAAGVRLIDNELLA